MIALGVASFQLMLDRGQHEDWFQSWEILIEGGIAIAALWVAVVHLATARRPLFERALFGDRNLVAGMFFMLLIGAITLARSEEHTSELQSLMRISYDVFCLKKKKNKK